MSDRAQSSLPRNAVRRLSGLALRGGIALGIVAGVAGAVLALNIRAEDALDATVAPPLPVEAMEVRLEPGHFETRRYVGRIEPERETALAFERGGRVVSVLVREGDAVAKGAVVARLDTELLVNERARLSAQRREQEARLDLARLTWGRQEGLTERATSGQRRDEARLATVQAEAALAQTDAALAGIDIQIAKSELRAPFAGRVAARHADDGAVLDAGSPIVALLETGAVTARLGVAPDAAAALGPGRTYELHHEGNVFPARLAALRPDLDTGSRTVTVLFEVVGAPDIPFGATIALEWRSWIDGPGYWVPFSALVEGMDGLWSVYVLDGSGSEASVGREAVVLAGVQGDRAFVQGSLRPGQRILLDGTHRVRPGQDVLIASSR
jgi:membrane fusion protein, multidrug efflux system